VKEPKPEKIYGQSALSGTSLPLSPFSAFPFPFPFPFPAPMWKTLIAGCFF